MCFFWTWCLCRFSHHGIICPQGRCFPFPQVLFCCCIDRSHLSVFWLIFNSMTFFLIFELLCVVENIPSVFHSAPQILHTKALFKKCSNCNMKMPQSDKHDYCLICLREMHNVPGCHVYQNFTAKAWSDRASHFKATLQKKTVSIPALLAPWMVIASLAQSLTALSKPPQFSQF